ncbi:MAG: hypothetical protein HY903_00095 [Deltaproteobacteria bacterium]|nr:hypothetical protein [Deltaproteobacteria bacterium]
MSFAPGPGLPGANLPLVAAVQMGYGHLRAAHSIAAALGVPVLRADLAPAASAAEVEEWRTIRTRYEHLTRLATRPWAGLAARWVLEALTQIPQPAVIGDFSAPSYGCRYLQKRIDAGLGDTLAAMVKTAGAPLLTTFYAVALALQRKVDTPVYCVVTDSDVNRIWAPPQPRSCSIRYLAPCAEVAQRLADYGVDRAQVRVTGFPLSDSLVGGRDRGTLKRNLRTRLGHLDPLGTFERDYGDAVMAELGHFAFTEGPVQLTFAVGGAGAQAGFVDRLLPAVGALIASGELRLVLVAGVRPEVEAHFSRALARAGMTRYLNDGIEVIAAPTIDSYLRRFDAALATTDILWTKPSELSFYAALGLPLMLAPAVGVHEERNRLWLVQQGAAVEQPEIEKLGWWLRARLADGSLARAAWNGAARLDSLGLYNILDVIRGGAW